MTTDISLSVEHAWSQTATRSWLLTSTGTYTDGDVRTIRYRLGDIEGDQPKPERKAALEELYFKILSGALAGKNAAEVTVASSWVEAGARTYRTVAHLSNWDKVVLTAEFNRKPQEAELEAVKAAHTAQLDQLCAAKSR